MPFQLLSESALNQCTVSEIRKGSKGQQYCEIRFADETPIFQLSASPLLSPFSAGTFQDDGTATRLNLDLTLDDACKKTLDQWDAFFADLLKKVAPGKAYHKLVQKTGEYPERVRLKVNSAGINACRLWDAQQTPLGNIRSVETAGANITACVKATKVWIMGPSCGVTLEAAHCVLHGGGAAQADVFPL
jgi:hypothetical protein